jgi:hypothetical protein
VTSVQVSRDVVLGDAVPVGREAALEFLSGPPLAAAAAIAEAGLLWEGGVMVEGPGFEAEFGGEEGKGWKVGGC